MTVLCLKMHIFVKGEKYWKIYNIPNSVLVLVISKYAILGTSFYTFGLEFVLCNNSIEFGYFICLQVKYSVIYTVHFHYL